MTTITKDIAAKLAVAFVALAFMFTAFAPAAQAQTTEELQAMINDLLAQVAALQGGGSEAMSSSDVCPFTWTRDLSSGSTGADVMALQKFLNSDPDTRVAAAGSVGSAGMETDYYGPATAAAVSKMQVKYRAEVLSPAGLVNPTGYFGPSSRAKANSVCVAAPEMEEGEEGEEEEEESGPKTMSGEASLDSFEIDEADDDELQEGAEDAPVAEVTFEFTDGDAEISRIDVAFTPDGGNDGDDDPWDVFETFQLWVDGDMVAEKDADDEDDYLDEDDGSMRFSGLDLFAEEDEELEVVIAVTLQNSLDGVDNGETWNVQVDAIRFFDADGVATTENGTVGPDDFGDSVSFDIDEEGAEDELIAKTNSSDPDAATLQVEDDSKSDWYTVFIFDLDTDDSENDIEINEIVLNVTTEENTTAADAGYSDLVADAELVIDGVTIDDVTVGGTSATAGTATLTFDVDGDVVIDAGDRVAAELMLRFRSLPAAEEGATVQGSISSLTTSIVDAEGADDLTNSQLSGAATGDTHTLRTAGADISPESTDAEVTSVDGDDNDYATFEIEIEVTAFEQDVYIPADGSTIAARVSTSTGSTSVSVTLDSSAEEENSRFEITEGSTETVTITYTHVQTQTGSNTTTGARLVLDSVGFYEVSSGGTLQTQVTLPATDYRTAQVSIIN